MTTKIKQQTNGVKNEMSEQTQQSKFQKTQNGNNKWSKDMKGNTKHRTNANWIFLNREAAFQKLSTTFAAQFAFAF